MAERPRSKALRCAIYARKSSEEGLEQDFNSLHAQREACEAFILSQRHEGWNALSTEYDDGGFSGGSLERPALQRLLVDVAAGQVDVIVVYKIDRLTRSLLDFARIVEVLDKRNVSFVSVTQQFNTTTSMGRLTLNVLLSFAQFEREVTGERIRDKIAASKRTGMWMGGFVPFGYDARDRTLVVNEAEALTVRTIFNLYLKMKNVRLVEGELARLGLRTKSRPLSDKPMAGNRPFSRGHIYKILSNPLYVGEIEHKGARHPGMHPAIVDRYTFDSVRAQLAVNGHEHRTRSRAKQPSLLAGLLYDAAGNRMIATHANKGGKRYRYYVTNGATAGEPASTNRSLIRIAAGEIESVVVSQLVAFLTDEHCLVKAFEGDDEALTSVADVLARANELAARIDAGMSGDQRVIVLEIVERVAVGDTSIQIAVKRATLVRRLPHALTGESRRGPTAVQIEVPVVFAHCGVEARLIIDGPSDGAPERTPNPALVKAIARGHVWLDELTSGRAPSIREIAHREGVSDRFVSILLNLGFLAPSMVEAIVNGRQPKGLTPKGLMFANEIPGPWPEMD